MVHRLQRFICPMTAMVGPPLFLLLLLSFQLSGQVSADQPPPGSVKVDSFNYAGSGCPPGSTESAVSDDGKSLTLEFKKFIATTERSRAHRKRSCIMSIKLSYPQGFAVGVGSVTLIGSAKLDRGVSGAINTSYYFGGQAGTARVTRKINGYFDDNFEYTNEFIRPVYSSCGAEQSLSIAAEVAVDPGKPSKGSGRIEVKSIPNGKWHFIWKRC